MAGLLDFLQSASNSAASNVSAPVDGLAWLLRKAGLDVGQPIGGSDWMQQQGLTRPVQQSGASLAGETMGLLAPIGAAAKASEIAAGLLAAGRNMAAPRNVSVGLSSGQRGVFGGELAKTADKKALDAAKKLEAGGADPRAVWQETGWFKGADKRWRFEIDDSGASLKQQSANAVDYMTGPGPANYPTTVGASIDHPELFAAYPEMRNMRATLLNSYGAGEFGRDQFGDFLSFAAQHKGGAYKHSDQSLSVLLHELQHGAQRGEGMARGGSQFVDDAETYLKLAGEVEARAVQARMKMSPQQRRSTFPLDSYDTPLDSLIVR